MGAAVVLVDRHTELSYYRDSRGQGLTEWNPKQDRCLFVDGCSRGANTFPIGEECLSWERVSSTKQRMYGKPLSVAVDTEVHNGDWNRLPRCNWQCTSQIWPVDGLARGRDDRSDGDERTWKFRFKVRANHVPFSRATF